MSVLIASKYKIGQLVECIHPEKLYGDAMHQGNGAGWKEGFRFKINKITYDRMINEAIYWEALRNCGVYEHALKLVSEEWDE